jgi:hypothetical protein
MTTKIRKSLLEAVSEVIYFDNLTEKEKIDHILKEDFNKDVRRYEKYHKEFSGVLTESQIDEGFLDTVKNFGKNALSSVTDAWKKAKQKGDEEEMARLQKKLDKLKTASDSGKKLPDVSSREKVAVMAGQSVIDELEKQDSKTADILKSSSPEKVADALENPNIKRKAEEIKKQIASETPASGESGFLGKVTSWMKKNPVKGAAAVALLSVVVGAAAVGSGGVLPLIGTVIGGAAKGAVVGGIGGGVVGAAKSAIGDKMAGNKFDLKKTAKAGLAGAKTGAIGGALAGAAGAVGKAAGKAVFDNDTLPQNSTNVDIQASKEGEKEAKSIIQKMKDAGFASDPSAKRPTWNGSFRQFEDPDSMGQKLISTGTDGTREYNYWLKQKLYGKISDQDFIEKMKEFARTGAQQ